MLRLLQYKHPRLWQTESAIQFNDTIRSDPNDIIEPMIITVVLSSRCNVEENAASDDSGDA